MPDANSISKQTKITLGLVILLLGGFGAGAFAVGGWAGRMEVTATNSETALEKILQTQEKMLKEQHTDSEAATYHRMLQMLNPDMRIPPVEE